MSKTAARTALKRSEATATRKRQERVQAAVVEHYRRLGEINAHLDRRVAEARQQAQEARRTEHARHRNALQEARAA